MGEREVQPPDEKSNSSGLSPFRFALYRTLWISALFSYVGAAMYDVGASWLMTSLVPNPLFVSLITTATTLPIFLFALPSGILSDIFDRRKILFIALVYMSAISAALGIITILKLVTPTMLLIFTFALGAGTTMIRTPIIPILSGLVTRSEIPAALTLSALAGNIGRVVGPTVGGFIVAGIAPWTVFFLYSASFIGMMMVISKLSNKSDVYRHQEQSSLPRENILRAMRAQIRYIRYSKAVHILIVRSGLFTLCSSALLSLLPFLVKHELGLDSIGFGLLLGSFGMGAVFGGIAILPKLRSMVSAESLISCSILLLALVMFLVGFVPNFNLLCIIMLLGGMAYITILSEFYTIGMKSAPKWIGSRVLAVYLLILNGGLAIGSIIWGIISNIFSIHIALAVASLALATTVLAKKRYNSTLLDDFDFTPAIDHWSLPPQFSIDSESDSQALIIIEYNKIDPKLSREFEKDIYELGRILKSEGMAYWELFQDPLDFGHYIEIRIADTWTDHLRHHERVTKSVKVMEDKIRILIKDCPPPVVSHYLGKSNSK